MSRCIAFLRAVNVGGHLVKMDALRAALEALGLTGVQTFIASGNVIFETRARDLAALERKIEAHLQGVFGFEIHTFIRTEAELAALVAHPAFGPTAIDAANTHVIGFLANAPNAQARDLIAGFGNDADQFHFHERELYWLSTHKQSEATFSNAAFEKALKMRTTFRGISTLRKLLGKVQSL
jgi:uncharacterized protein (DUF1697 family)